MASAQRKGSSQGGMLHPAHEVDDQDLQAGGGVQLHVALARGAGGVVGGPDQPGLGLEVGDDVLDVEGVVAGGDDVDPQLVQPFPGDALGDAVAVGGVLAVDDDEIQGQFPPQRRADGPPPASGRVPPPRRQGRESASGKPLTGRARARQLNPGARPRSKVRDLPGYVETIFQAPRPDLAAPVGQPSRRLGRNRSC